MNTLLRYPGGKSKAVKKIIPYFPKDLKEMCSPFFGGGAIEIYMAKTGVKVFGYDYLKQLVLFWNCAIRQDKKFLYCVSNYLEVGVNKERFKQLQQALSEEEASHEYIAAWFYVVNRCSFSGTTLSGGMSPNTPRFNQSSVDRLKRFDINNITVSHSDFEDSIMKHKDIFKYCDPPYLIESNLYGVNGDKHKDFDHQRLANVLKSVDNWILSYNDCKWVRETYKEYTIVEIDFAYGMSKSKTELLIVNT